MIRSNLLACASLATLVAAPANAEFIFGGELTLERDIEENGGGGIDTNTNIRGELVIGYDTGDFAFGVGTRFRESHDDFEIEDENEFYFATIGPVTISHGFGYGAGNMVSEDYFGLSDTTSEDSPSTRIDVALDNFHLAVSREDSGDYELGLATSIANHFVRIGYEDDDEDFQIAVGRDVGDWGYHVVLHRDFDSNSATSQQLGGTLLYDINDAFRIAGHLAIDGDAELDSYGLAAWYEFGGEPTSFGPATLSFEYLNNVNADLESVELRLNIPFGNAAPHLFERKANKEEISGFGYY
ncbi:MAG: hypothetical protein GKR99_03720 [Rhodobacteraceae bacterium]|nr:hypothetical protein [Paracoccaceae bacterium]